MKQNLILPDDFKFGEYYLCSDFSPAGDQPEAINELVKGVRDKEKYQILYGVTGSGKTFTIASLIAQINKPTLVLSHNKTLAAQLYGEFKNFFPYNAVEYFVSYYDYYQPEAYLPTTDKYIEKELSINEELEKLRLKTTTSLLSNRRDVVVVSSVSCLYGIGNPEDFHANIIEIKTGQIFPRNKFLKFLVDSMYSRDDHNLSYGKFRVKGDSIDLYLAYGDAAYKIVFFDDEIEEIFSIDPTNNKILAQHESIRIYPANIFMTNKSKLERAMIEIRRDLDKQIAFFIKEGKDVEAQRISDRVNYDLEMLSELGYCSGVENYSRYFDGRSVGSRPFCLLDYFPDDFLIVIDESHVTLPQIRGMYGGNLSRKNMLVDYGFRLPAAIDNRPLKFEEFEALAPQTVYMSATPGDYELEKTQGVVVEQVVRPTGLIDPPIEVRPTENQIDDLLDEIQHSRDRNERTLVTTLTKRMAEDLSTFLQKLNIKTQYIHSEVTALKRIEIMEELRDGTIDVLVGVNLLREGLDLPEVSLVAILDADKEGFLRSVRSLTQTAGRAARNINGRVIMYADHITKSMQQTIDETERRRKKQIEFNEKHNITPKQIVKSNDGIFSSKSRKSKSGSLEEVSSIVETPQYSISRADLLKSIEKAEREMKRAAAKLDYSNAKIYRDEMFSLKKIFTQKFKN